MTLQGFETPAIEKIVCAFKRLQALGMELFRVLLLRGEQHVGRHHANPVGFSGLQRWKTELGEQTA